MDRVGDMSRWAANMVRRRARRTTILRRENAGAYTSTVLSAPLAASATAAIIKAAGGSRLSGTVVAGSKFTIAGVTGTYTLSADVTAPPPPAAGVVTITFTPAIPVGQSAAIGAVLTFTQKYGEVTYPVLSRQASVDDVKAIENGESVKVLPFEKGKAAPRVGDRLDGVPVVRVETIDADDGVAYYRCHIVEATP